MHLSFLARSVASPSSKDPNDTILAFQAVWDGGPALPASLRLMAEVDGKIESLLHQLSQEGLLNEQFQQLMQLQDESNPNFVKVCDQMPPCCALPGLERHDGSFLAAEGGSRNGLGLTGSLTLQEVVELYFQDSAVKLERLSARLAETPPDYSEVDALVHQFKGSSASFGAQTITQHCVQVLVLAGLLQRTHVVTT